MGENEGGVLPLGLCRQAVLKLESAASDIREIIEEEGLDATDKENFEKMAEIIGVMMANIVNIVSKEIGEEEFLAEQPELDEIGQWPGSDVPIGEEPIGDDGEKI